MDQVWHKIGIDGSIRAEKDVVNIHPKNMFAIIELLCQFSSLSSGFKRFKRTIVLAMIGSLVANSSCRKDPKNEYFGFRMSRSNQFDNRFSSCKDLFSSVNLGVMLIIEVIGANKKCRDFW